MKLIFGGHWCGAPAGWTALRQWDQDITKPLAYGDGTVDAIFTEHVVEHVGFADALHFMRESLRVLRPGGIFRCVAPMVDAFVGYRDDDLSRRYANDTLKQFYGDEHRQLQSLGLGLDYDPLPFLVDGLVRKHGHQFIWSERLMCAVLFKLGFREVAVAKAGFSLFDATTCLERRVRGVHEENLRRDLGAAAPETYDPESGFVEARK